MANSFPFSDIVIKPYILKQYYMSLGIDKREAPDLLYNIFFSSSIAHIFRLLGSHISGP
jgi:hypothetical protein